MIYLLEQDGSLPQSKKAREILAFGLEREYGISVLPDIEKTSDGKPYFPKHPDIHFNLSHAKQGILCGISDCEIGVDIERIIAWKDTLSRHITHPKEFEFLMNIEPGWKRERMLTRIWTVKESYLKCTGLGLRTDLRKLCLTADDSRWFQTGDYFVSCYDGTDYELAVCECAKVYRQPNLVKIT